MFAPGLKLGRAGGGRGDVCDPASEDGRAGVAAGEGEEGRISMLVIPENDNFGAGGDVRGEDCAPASDVGLAGVEAGTKEERRRSRLEIPDDEAGGEYCVPASEVCRADIDAGRGEEGRISMEEIPETANTGARVCVPLSTPGQAASDTEPLLVERSVCVPLSTPGQAGADVERRSVRSVCVPRAEVSMVTTEGSL